MVLPIETFPVASQCVCWQCCIVCMYVYVVYTQDSVCVYCTCALVYVDLLTSMKGLHELEYQVIESCRVL